MTEQSSNEPVARTRRDFRVNTAIIRNLIKAQAGTLSKAVLEYVMNAIDAGSTEVRITLSESTVTIADTGKGFATRKEIEDWFEDFGFEHFEGDGRTYGRFGIGRAQLWNFASTLWRTSSFSMDVDIREKGLDYELVEGLEPVIGTTVTGTFYEPLDLRARVDFEREFLDLVKYSYVPVYLNGELISKAPDVATWTHDTPEAYILLNNSRSLNVYNLGVLVRSYPVYMVGSGGIVVTKPGVRLELNMARNDVLQHSCAVWKKIKPLLQRMVDKAQAKKPEQSEAVLSNVALRLVSGELNWLSASDYRLVKDITGRSHTLSAALRGAQNRSGKLCAGKRGDQAMEALHKSKTCFVILEETLDRFNAESVSDLETLFKRVCPQPWLLRGVEFIDDTVALRKAVSSNMIRVPDSKLKPAERVALLAIRTYARLIRDAVAQSGYYSCDTVLANRQIQAGEAAAAHAWTDGSSYIALRRETLALANQGYPGFYTLASILVHEYLHGDASTDTHSHDQSFYEGFESVTTDAQSALRVGRFVQNATARYLRLMHEKKLPLTAALRGSLDVEGDADDLDLPQADLIQDDALRAAA